jgi:hypothetical protein
MAIYACTTGVDMTQDEIIDMARQAGFLEHEDQFYTNHEYGDCKLELKAFAKLVAAKEREACAKIVQTHYEANDDLRTKGSLASVLDYIKFRGEA